MVTRPARDGGGESLHVLAGGVMARWRRWVGAAVAVAVVVLAWTVVDGDRLGGRSPLDAEAWRRAGAFVESLVGVGNESTPAYLRGEVWRELAPAAWQTFQTSFLAASIAGVVALVTLPLAARPGRRRVGPVGRLVRGFYLLTRAVPEIVWAWILLLVLRPGAFTAALVLGLHNAGVVGRLGVDIVEDLPARPHAALVASGAGRAQAFVYGSLPRLAPQVLTFLLYRWEVIIRTTVVVGYVVQSGLGIEFRLALSARQFTTVATIVMIYVGLVLLVDLLSTLARRLVH